MEEKHELPHFSEAPRAPAPDPGEGLSTPAAGPDTYIGPTSSMRSVTTLSEHVGLQADQEQVLCRELVCVCDELQSCCEHAASAVTVHPRVQTLFLTRPSALLQAGTTSEWMCGESIEQQMQQERRAILELPFVSGISDAAHGKRGGFRVNLRCHTAQEHGNCECGGLKQGVPVLVSSTRTTLLECLQEVHNQVLRQHGSQCVAASKALQAERMAQANSPAASQDALRTMMYLSQAQQCLTKATAELNNIKQRADKVHKEALELEKAVDVAAKTVMEARIQAVRNSSRCHSGGLGWFTRVHASTMEIALSGSRGGFTEWMRMPQVLHLRSGIQSRTLTTRRLLYQ